MQQMCFMYGDLAAFYGDTVPEPELPVTPPEPGDEKPRWRAHFHYMVTTETFPGPSRHPVQATYDLFELVELEDLLEDGPDLDSLTYIVVEPFKDIEEL